MIEITSDAGTIGAAVEPDPTLRRAVVSITHGWGGLPEDTIYERDGSNTGILISTDRDFDPINAMPRMSAVPVNITPVRGPEGEIRNSEAAPIRDRKSTPLNYSQQCASRMPTSA